ncbi:MAG: M23 family metallopeptidase [Gemmatimonadaceae bacterium]
MVYVVLRRAIWISVLFVAAACSRKAPSVVPEPASGAETPRENRRNRNNSRLPARPEYRESLEAGVTESDLNALWAERLMVPVHGFTKEGLKDTYTAPRSGDRNHRAIDLLAPAGTPVIATDDQVIGRLGDTPLGGIIIYASDLAAHFVYYYAHLKGYRSGLAVGDTVARGEVIGYVGSTGNASPNEPHLHFQVMKRGDGRAWWDGPPINPYIFFAFDGRKK